MGAIRASGGVGVINRVLGAGKEYRCSRARRGIGGIRVHLGIHRGCWECWGHQGV